MNSKENYLEAIRYGSPEYVPLSYFDPTWFDIGFLNQSKMENWTDRFGITWEMAAEDTVPFPVGNPLADIEKSLDNYVFPDPNTLVIDPDAFEKLKTLDRSNVLVAGGLSYFCFERVWALMGMENFFAALIEFPDLVKHVLHKIADYARVVFDRYLELGVDAVGFSEDLGTQRALMISPKHFREFFLPEYKHAFENVVKEGKIINFHSCGCVEEIAGDLAEIGVTTLNPVQARANDLHKLKKAVFGKTALSGGIDTHLLMKGTPAEVQKETERVMEILKPGGGFVCGPDQYFANMPIENLDIMWQTIRDTGKY